MRLLALLLIASCGTPAPPAGGPLPESARDSVAVASAPDTSVVTVSGIYHSGFEASALTPCDRDGETWWVQPDESFAAAYDALYSQHVPTLRRGTRFYAQTEVTGVLYQGHDHGYGHLGQYEGEIQVTGTHEFTFLALDPDEPPTCS